MNRSNLTDRSRLRQIPLIAGLMGLWCGLTVFGASSFTPSGNEYAVAGNLPGDQGSASATLLADSGMLVWQDHSSQNLWTIRSRHLSKTGTGIFTPIAVSTATDGDQTLSQVAKLKGGNVAFVWRGGPLGSQGIHVRVLKAGVNSNTFVTDDTVISRTGGAASKPSVAALDDGTFVVSWASDNADGDMFGVLSRHLGPSGEFLGEVQPVTVTFAYNQRNPMVVPLPGAQYVICWVSENQRFQYSVDVYSRKFSASGNAISDETRLNYGTNVCSQPCLAPLASGGYLAAWVETDPGSDAAPWSIYLRSFDASGNSLAPSIPLASDLVHNQNSPSIAVAGDTAMVVWQASDSIPNHSRVYGKYISLDGNGLGDAFPLSAIPLLAESNPYVTSNGSDTFLATWSGFRSLDLGTEISARKFTGVVLSAPTVLAQSRNGAIHLSWDTVPGGVYQILASTDFTNWSKLGDIRTATGSSDSVDVVPNGSTRFFRISRTR